MSFIEDKLEVWDTLMGEVFPVEYYQLVVPPEAKPDVKSGTPQAEETHQYNHLNVKNAEYSIMSIGGGTC